MEKDMSLLNVQFESGANSKGESEFLVITAGIFPTSYIKVTLAGIFAERIDQIFAFQNRVQRIFQCKFGHFHAQDKIPPTCRSNIISIIKQL